MPEPLPERPAPSETRITLSTAVLKDHELSRHSIVGDTTIWRTLIFSTTVPAWNGMQREGVDRPPIGCEHEASAVRGKETVRFTERMSS
jgi:hypothetical protein